MMQNSNDEEIEQLWAEDPGFKAAVDALFSRKPDLVPKVYAILLAHRQDAAGRPITATCPICHGLLHIDRGLSAIYTRCEKGCTTQRIRLARSPLGTDRVTRTTGTDPP